MDKTTAGYLFGSFGKIIFWIVFIVVFCLACAYPVVWVFVVVLLIIGPVIAIPAILAAHGKHVFSTKNKEELKRIIGSEFIESKWSKTGGPGVMNFQLDATFIDMAMAHGNGPVVSVDIDVQPDTVLVSIWMSQSTSGGLNKGKGTPFYTLGASRANRKIKDVAALVGDTDYQSQGVVINPSDGINNIAGNLSSATKKAMDAIQPIAANAAKSVNSVIKTNKPNSTNPASLYCPYCGKEVKADAKFCRYCGGNIQSDN